MIRLHFKLPRRLFFPSHGGASVTETDAMDLPGTVASGGSCQGIATIHDITFDGSYKYIPTVGTAYSPLWGNLYTCVGLK